MVIKTPQTSTKQNLLKIITPIKKELPEHVLPATNNHLNTKQFRHYMHSTKEMLYLKAKHTFYEYAQQRPLLTWLFNDHRPGEQPKGKKQNTTAKV